MRFAAVLVLAFACSAALASQPGQPLGGEDFVFLVPGITGVDYVVQEGLCGYGGGPDGNASASYVCEWQQGASIDVQGSGFVVRPEYVHSGTFCGGTELRRLEIYRRDASAVLHLLAYLDARCGPGGQIDYWDWPWDPTGVNPNLRFNFDPFTGKLRFRLQTTNPGCDLRSTCADKVIEFSGFATTFDVLQTFTPQPALAVRVPYMPEGLPAADHFDTYWGPLSHPIDFTHAQSLQCDYPATQPHVGDYLAVNDPLPDPAPGSGYYYVTAATYQGQTRYGRKSTAGHMSGRDPALLPECVQPSLNR